MLLGNYNTFNSNPGHSIGGPTDPALWFKGGSLMMFYGSENSAQREKSSFNDGYRPPYSWVLAPKAGGLSSHNAAVFTLTPTGAAQAGVPISGSTSVTISSTATGGLIVSGSGSATIELSSTGTLISIAAGSGTATVTLSGSALIGALAGLSGSSSITLTPAAVISAIGYLSGISTNETEFSEAALARAVWTALASDYNVAGSMGEKLNDAGSAGNPWASLLADNSDAGTFGERIQKLLTLANFLGLK